MCTGAEVPLLLGVAASAAGTGLSMAASAEDQAAMNKAADASLAQQQGYADKAKSAFQESLSQSTPDVAKQTINDQTATSLAQYAMQQQQPTGFMSASQQTPMDQAQSQAVIGQGNMARAAMQGYPAWSTQQYLKNLGANQLLGNLGAESSFAAGALPLQMQQASQVGAPLALAGSGLGALGSLAGLYGVYSGLNRGSTNQFGYVNANAPPSQFQVPTSQYNAGTDFIGYR